MAVATLSIDLEARLASLQAGLDKAGLLAERQAARIEGTFRGIQTASAGIGTALAGAFSGAVVLGFTRSIVDSLDALNDFADATGSSIENASALEDVALRTGTALETASAAVQKLNKVLADAKPGSEAARAIEALGLSATALRTLDPAEALRQVSVALQQIEDPGQRARFQIELLGKSAGSLAPFLGDLAKQGRLNATVTAEQARQAEAFKQNLSALQKTALDTARDISGPLISALNQLFAAVKGEAAGGGASISDLITVPLQAAGVVGANVAFVLKGIGREIGGIAAQAAALGRGDFSAVKLIGEEIRFDAKKSRAELDLLEKRLLEIGRVIPQADYSNEGRVVRSFPDPAVPSKDLFTPYIDRLREALRATQDLTIAEQTRVDIAEGKLGNLTNAQRDYAIELAGVLDLARQPAALVGPDIPADLLAARKRQADELRALIGSSSGAQFDALVNQTRNLIDSFQTGETSATDYARGIEVLGQRFKDLEPTVQATTEGISAFSQQAAANIQDALGDTLQQTLAGNFSNIGQLWRNLLTRMAAEAAAARLNSYLFGPDFAKSGVVGGAIGRLFGGGSLGDLFGPLFGPRASGGPVLAGGQYVVGERGPELFRPRQSGSIVPNGAPMGGGVAVTLAPTINIDARSDQAQVAQVVAAGMAQAQQSMWRQLKARGLA